MRKTTRIIKKILDEFKSESIINESFINKENSIIISLNFEFKDFYKFNSSVSDFFKKLTNNKNSLTGRMNNREWWLSLSNKRNNEGFYRFNITHNFVRIIIFLTTDKKVNEIELKSRINKITPRFTIEIKKNNKLNFNEFLGDIVSLESGFSLFGDFNKRNNRPL